MLRPPGHTKSTERQDELLDCKAAMAVPLKRVAISDGHPTGRAAACHSDRLYS